MKITFENESGQKVTWSNISESDLRKYFNLSALSRENGLAESSVRSRLHRGMPLLLALSVEPE